MLSHRSKWGIVRGNMQEKRRKIGTCETEFTGAGFSRKASVKTEISETKDERNKNDVTT